MLLRKAILIAQAILCLLFYTGCGKAERPAFVSLDAGRLESKVIATIGRDESPESINSAGGHGGEAADNGLPAFIIQFSRDADGTAYVSRRSGKAYLVHNSNAYGPYEGLGDFTISPDGSRVTFVVKRGRKWTLAIDGKEYGSYDELGDPVFSPDSRHVAVEARMGERWRVVVDGRFESRPCESYYEKPIFSADSKRLLLIENTKDVMIKNLVISAPDFRDVKVHQFRGGLFVMAEDGKRFGVVDERADGKRLMQFNFDRPDLVDVGPSYDDLSYISFSKDGIHTAYAAIKKDKRYLILDNRTEELPKGDLVSLPVIRPDGKGLVIFMSDKDGVWPHEAFYATGLKKKRCMQAGDFMFSPDGRHYAYTCTKDNILYLVLDGKEIKTGYDVIVSPIFSPDSGSLAMRAKRQGKRFVATLDIKTMKITEHPVFERIFEPFFSGDGAVVSYGVKEGSNLTRKSLRLR